MGCYSQTEILRWANRYGTKREHESANKSRGSFLFMVFATLQERQNHNWNERNDHLGNQNLGTGKIQDRPGGLPNGALVMDTQNSKARQQELGSETNISAAWLFWTPIEVDHIFSMTKIFRCCFTPFILKYVISCSGIYWSLFDGLRPAYFSRQAPK